MLPIFEKRALRKPVVTHFIAIQKDVTLLKQENSSFANWLPEEVALWVEYLKCYRYAQVLLKNEISGAKLLEMDDTSLVNIGVITSKHRAKILKAIQLLKANDMNAYKIADILNSGGDPRVEVNHNISYY